MQCSGPDEQRLPPDSKSNVVYANTSRWGSFSNFIVMSITTKTRKPIDTKAKTGEICPESGVWKVVGYPTTTAPIAEGNRMPPYDGKAVTWELTQYA